MGGFSRLTRRRVPPVTHTDALFAGQSHSIPDNLVALLGTSRAWNCSDPERVFGNTSGFAETGNLLERCPLSEVIPKQIPTGSFTARDPQTTLWGARHLGLGAYWTATPPEVPITTNQ